MLLCVCVRACVCVCVCVCVPSMEGDEFSAGEEEGDFEEGGTQEEEMVEFITNGEGSFCILHHTAR